MPHRWWPSVGHLGQSRSEVARDRNSLQSVNECLEPCRDSGSTDLGQSSSIPIDHAQRSDVGPQLLRKSDPDDMVWCDHQLSAGRELRADSLLDLARQVELYLSVSKPGGDLAMLKKSSQ